MQTNRAPEGVRLVSHHLASALPASRRDHRSYSSWNLSRRSLLVLLTGHLLSLVHSANQGGQARMRAPALHPWRCYVLRS